MSVKHCFRGVLIDLSGTIHIDDAVIPGAVEAIKKLKTAGLPVKFATNTTKESKRILHERLVRLGFDINPSEIFTSLTAAADVVSRLGQTPFLMIDDSAMEDFSHLTNKPDSSKEASSVVIGLAPKKFDYENMNIAMRILHAGGKLVAVHKARYYRKGDGSLALGPGPFVTALEHACDIEATVVGKPSKTFFLQAIENFVCDPCHVAMIGDDVKDDVIGAQKAGLVGMLVKTGKFRSGDEAGTEESKPDFVFSSVGEAIEYILCHTESP